MSERTSPVSSSSATIQCHACGRKFRWSPKLAGKHVRCKCGETMSVPAAAPAPAMRTAPQPQAQYAAYPPPTAAPADNSYELDVPTQTYAMPQQRLCRACGVPMPPGAELCLACGDDPYFDDQPMRRSSRPRQNTQWSKTVAVGLRLMLLAMVVMILGGVLAGAAGQELMRSRSSGGGGMLILSGAAILVGGVMSIIGLLMCLATPSDTAARGFIIVSIVLQIAGGVLPVVGEDEVMLTVIGGLCGFIGVLCFLLFMRELGEYIENESVSSLARQAMTLIGVLIVCCVLVGIMGAFAAMSGGRGGGPSLLPAVLGLVVLVVAIWYVVKFIQLLLTGANALDQYGGLGRRRGRRGRR